MLALCLFLYEQSRVLMLGKSSENTVHAAFSTANHIIVMEHHLGLDFEPTLQALLLDQKWLVLIGNAYYAVMHFVVPCGILACVVIGNHDAKFQHRSSYFIMLATALVIFLLLPTMPPRLLDRYRQEYSPEFDQDVANYLEPYWSIVDTMAKGNTLYDKLHKEGGIPYAAMPSMHAGSALWCALMVMDIFPSNTTTFLAMSHVFWTVFFTILSGNHFWLDAVGGAACVFIGRRVAAKGIQDSILQPVGILPRDE